MPITLIATTKGESKHPGKLDALVVGVRGLQGRDVIGFFPSTKLHIFTWPLLWLHFDAWLAC
jgi:hypothetical protein